MPQMCRYPGHEYTWIKAKIKVIFLYIFHQEKGLSHMVHHYALYSVKADIQHIMVTVKVSNGAKIRNRYNQVPHLTQDTNGKVTNSQKTPQTRAKRSALDHKAHINRRTQNIANTRQNKNIKDPQKKYRLGTVSKIFYWRA